jgi:nitroimidazol reductase NimA-like FMN-containing flavoprotein (pyridoxamine 5'-phosphate oxidase superfamily)
VPRGSGTHDLGRLGWSLGNQPYIVSVCLASEGDFIYVFSTHGKKIVWMRANPEVCIQIDEVKGQSQWSSVIVNGL